MSKFLVAGIVQIETIVEVDQIPIQYAPVTSTPNTIFTNIGGDAYNTSIALKWLGNSVDFMTMISKNEDPQIINPIGSDETLFPDYVLTRLSATPTAVILYDKTLKQQIYEDIKDLRDTPYDIRLFKERVPAANMVFLSNANFCRPLIQIAKDAHKTIAVNIREFKTESLDYNADFLENADILYISDDNLVKDPYDFVREIADIYNPAIIVLGQGSKGVILYSREENILAHYNTVKTNEVVNTVGAGNALFSCFLHYYNKTGDAVTAIKNALLFASYKIGFIGTSNGFMTEEEIEQWRNLIWK